MCSNQNIGFPMYVMVNTRYFGAETRVISELLGMLNVEQTGEKSDTVMEERKATEKNNSVASPRFMALMSALRNGQPPHQT